MLPTKHSRIFELVLIKFGMWTRTASFCCAAQSNLASVSHLHINPLKYLRHVQLQHIQPQLSRSDWSIQNGKQRAINLRQRPAQERCKQVFTQQDINNKIFYFHIYSTLSLGPIQQICKLIFPVYCMYPAN